MCYSFDSLLSVIPIVITLVTGEGGSEELLVEVEREVKKLDLGINITVDSVDRFGREIKC